MRCEEKGQADVVSERKPVRITSKLIFCCTVIDGLIRFPAVQCINVLRLSAFQLLSILGVFPAYLSAGKRRTENRVQIISLYFYFKP